MNGNVRFSTRTPFATGITAANVKRLVRQQVQIDGTADSSPIYLHGVEVGGADESDHRGADQDRVRLGAVRKEHDARGDDRGEDREAAEARRRELVQSALARHVDRADPPGERAGDRRCQEAHYEGEPEGEKAVGEGGHS